jgi:hypothetical protein
MVVRYDRLIDHSLSVGLHKKLVYGRGVRIRDLKNREKTKKVNAVKNVKSAN